MQSALKSKRPVADWWRDYNEHGYELGLEPVVMHNAKLLFAWANDPEVRAASFCTDPIEWEEHAKWLQSKIDSPLCRMYLAWSTNMGQVGVIRFDFVNDDEALVSVTVSSKYRNKGRGVKGCGTLLIKQGCERLFRETKIKKVRAEIKVNNPASVRAFESAGFCWESTEGHLVYVLNAPPQFCKRCLMPNTRPGAIFEDGECQACRNYDTRQQTDWKARWEELETLCGKHRHSHKHGCLIPVSGGKDSHFLVHALKNRLHMNPLLFTVADPFTKTKAGHHNLKNLVNAFACDHYTYTPNDTVHRQAMRWDFENSLHPLQWLEQQIYAAPPKFAAQLDIPLVFYGENSAFLYGTSAEDEREMAPGVFWMSYFTDWDDEKNFEVAQRYGFRSLVNEWERSGWIEPYTQIDSYGYLVHIWAKYPKFGFQRTTDMVARHIRKGLLSKDEGKDIILKHDRHLDQDALADFAAFAGYTPKEFWDIVEKFWNPTIFEKVDDVWHMKAEIRTKLMEA